MAAPGLNREQLEARLEALQATWSMDLNGVTLSVPRARLEEAFGLLMSVWSEPLLPREEFDRMKASDLAGIEAGRRIRARWPKTCWPCASTTSPRVIRASPVASMRAPNACGR
jgi:hypothetical protein